MTKGTAHRIWYLALVGAVILAITILLNVLVPYGNWLDYLIRGAALFAYQTLFVVILSTPYLREMVRFFGRPFIKVHHIATITALVLIILHPIGVAFRYGSAGVFVPTVSSISQFLANGGRADWYLLGIAALAAVTRNKWAKGWRTVHWLAYVAFLLITVHGLLLGSNLQFPAVRVVVLLMALAVVLTFGRKRMAGRARKVQREAASSS